MGKEQISVIVLTYNSSSTLIDTLESIKNQTYSNIEIIVSDDFSLDDTISIAQKWFDDNCIKGKICGSDKNYGVPHNLNKGILASSNELFKFIAGDDVLVPNAIEEFYDCYERDSSVIWQCKIEPFSDSFEVSDYIKGLYDNYSFFELNVKEQYKRLCVGNQVSAVGLGLISKEWINKYGQFDETYKMFEDYTFVLKMSKMGYRYRLIDKRLVRYRINEKSITGIGSRKYYDDLAKFFFNTRAKALVEERMWTILIKQFVKYSLIRCGLFVGKDKYGKLKIERLR